MKEDDRGTVYELSVHPDDVGKVIGKQGRIAKAIRTVVASALSKRRSASLSILFRSDRTCEAGLGCEIS